MALILLILFLIGATADRYHPEEPARATERSAKINPAEYTADYWINKARAAIEKRSKRDDDQRVAKNLVMFLGDGMSVPTLAAARTLKGQRAGATGEETELYFENFPGVGLVKVVAWRLLDGPLPNQPTIYACKKGQYIDVLDSGLSRGVLRFLQITRGVMPYNFQSWSYSSHDDQLRQARAESPTYCVNMQIPDSACTATAYLTGVKGNYGTVGVTAAVNRRNCSASLEEANRVQSIAEWALAAGKDVGIVTTTRVSHASPSATYAKIANRNWEHDAIVIADNEDPERCIDIARQLITMNPGNQFKVILGGGRRGLLPNTTVDEEGIAGRRTDGRNLIQQWQQDKVDRNLSYSYVWNREELMKLFDSPPEYLLGLFEGTHMMYNLEANPVTEPTLEELTELAIKMLSRNEKGFFLFVEGGRIDHAHHANYVHLALDETLELDKSVEKAGEMLNEEDTLIVVTADHAHVMTYNGYTARGGDILGISDERDENGVPYMTLSYTNGPGGRVQDNGMRTDVTEEDDFGQLNWRSHADALRESETHGGDDVAVFARGPHYRMFTGLYDQNQIPHIMAYAACIGPGIHAEGCNSASSIHLF